MCVLHKLKPMLHWSA